MPKITVLMPVFNGAEHLSAAIDSILKQSFTDFELLIIDDGSTDNSLKVIRSYHDARIRLTCNETNLGVANSLNRGLELCRGEFIARMDADDVSMPHRLKRQTTFLDQHSDVCCVAVKVQTIDKNGMFLGYWDDDINTTTFEEIEYLLPRRNCIAHPGIMIRSNVIKEFRYNCAVKHAEDYDLWMRLVASGHRIEKINELLVSYRITPTSITSTSNAKSPKRKVLSVKLHYLLWACNTCHIGKFTFRVFFSFLADVFKGAADTLILGIKSIISQIHMWVLLKS